MNELPCFMWSLERLRAELPEHPVITEATNLPDFIDTGQELLTRRGEEVFVLSHFKDGTWTLSLAISDADDTGAYSYLYETLDREEDAELYRQAELLFETAIMEILL